MCWVGDPVNLQPIYNSTVSVPDGRYPNQPGVQPEDEHDIQSETTEHGNEIVRPGGRNSRYGALGAMLHRDAVYYCPDEEGTEQDDIGQHAIGEKVGDGPELGGYQHGVLGGCLDASREVGG